MYSVMLHLFTSSVLVTKIPTDVLCQHASGFQVTQTVRNMIYIYLLFFSSKQAKFKGVVSSRVSDLSDLPVYQRGNS